jgi:predicted aldo/keto reductase-like oxidoreductase
MIGNLSKGRIFVIYRTLGKTGLKVSQLGFGCMRLPMTGRGDEARVDRDLATPMIHRALDAGVNYVDTAVGYCNGDSQCAVGEALEGRRDQVVLSTKNPYYGPNEKEWWQNLEDSLRRLRTDHIDIYNHHGMGYQAYVNEVAPRVSHWMRKAREQGLIRHICNSFHEVNEDLKRLVDTGYTSVITLQYNILDRRLEEGIAYAHEHGVGVVVMGPLGGGRLGATAKVLEDLVPGVRRVPELALRFVLSNPNVSVALSGMSTMQQVQENVAVGDNAAPIGQADSDLLMAHVERLKAMADLYCTGCGYCMPCPNEVNIPMIFDRFNWGRVYGLWEPARGGYDVISRFDWAPGKRADACIQCGACEKKCPQKLPIRKQLQEAHEALKGERNLKD